MESKIINKSESDLDKRLSEIPEVEISQAEIDEIKRIQSEGVCSGEEEREVLEILGLHE